MPIRSGCLRAWLKETIFPKEIVDPDDVMEKACSALVSEWEKATYGIEITVVLSKTTEVYADPITTLEKEED
jgi:hypothetical protein